MADKIDIGKLARELASISKRARDLEAHYSEDLTSVHPEFHESARNLLHYVALRQSDISQLQESLAALGLSTLERAERNVMGSIATVWSVLQSLADPRSKSRAPPLPVLPLSDFSVASHKQAILGTHPEGRDVSIMVTLPTEAAQNATLVAEMIAAGMNVARINCAHDDASVWAGMVANIRTAAAAAEVECRILMDLAGPKIRTGALQPGPGVLHIRPRRDALGCVVAPRRIRFMPDDQLQRGTKAAVVPVPVECIEIAEPGDEFLFKDTRGKKRRLKVVEKDAKGLVLESYKGAYIATGTKLCLIRKNTAEKLKFRVGELPAIEQPLLLRVGDTLVLHRSNAPGARAKEGADGQITSPAHIACQQPEVFQFIAPGDPVSLNDGKIAGIVTAVSRDEMQVEVTKAKPTGSNLRANRGINFPGSDIRLPGLTDPDRTNLAFAAEHADAVSLSFVREPQDITLLQEALRSYHDRNLGVVIKIETKRGFRNLPWLLLTAMRSYPAGVIIARGDLAVECGWERLAEIQEEILWFCEAAQVPVIWATQVLEGITKKGRASRAEISDAAMAQRADCVMLNKGAHVLAAIRMLDDILRRMQKHQYKKTALMRKLEVADAGS